MSICAWFTCTCESSALSLHSLESNILAVEIANCPFMLQLIILCTTAFLCNSPFHSAVQIINVFDILLASMLASKIADNSIKINVKLCIKKESVLKTSNYYHNYYLLKIE